MNGSRMAVDGPGGDIASKGLHGSKMAVHGSGRNRTGRKADDVATKVHSVATLLAPTG